MAINILKVLLVVLCLGLASSYSLGGSVKRSEGFFSDKWCEGIGGHYKRSQTRLEDVYGYTYPDCITETEVIEADWAEKWYEGVGQMFHYARLTGKKPAILILLKSEEDYKYLYRMDSLEKWFESGASRVDVEVYYIKTWEY